MTTIIRTISTNRPHKVPVSKCQGRLRDPADQYQEFAYWHGDESMSGWYAEPLNGVDYIACLDQQYSKFVIDEAEAKRFSLM